MKKYIILGGAIGVGIILSLIFMISLAILFVTPAKQGKPIKTESSKVLISKQTPKPSKQNILSSNLKTVDAMNRVHGLSKCSMADLASDKLLLEFSKTLSSKDYLYTIIVLDDKTCMHIVDEHWYLRVLEISNGQYITKESIDNRFLTIRNNKVDRTFWE